MPLYLKQKLTYFLQKNTDFVVTISKDTDKNLIYKAHLSCNMLAGSVDTLAYKTHKKRN
jgi:hypothetical protein